MLYPDDWSPYSCDELNFDGKQNGETLYEAIKQIDLYKLHDNIETTLKPVDKSLWRAAPTWFNCAYNPSQNSIYIFGAFARGAIYNPEMSDEELLGTIGFVIGHEISHAFDSRGCQYEKDGNLSKWWSDENMETFARKNQKLADYFNAMHPWEGQNFNGDTMTGEACADMASIKCMLRVAEKIEDFDYDVFFTSIANLWLLKGTLQYAYFNINDVHPMPYLRVNASLQQFDEFIDLYDIKPGDNMYLPEEDRVKIW